jgi:coenzyme F420-0:L-glutamate ligase/coenzyme F420-1:gamma-L-glutamate ligase
LATHIALADELASAADLTRDKDSGVPGAIVSGLGDLVTADDGPGARALPRAAEEDLFR